jgi:hypothetical protein
MKSENLSETETKSRHRNSLLNDEGPKLRVYNISGSPRIIHLGYSAKGVAKKRRRLYRNHVEDIAHKKKVISQHKASIRRAGKDPKKAMNPDSK